MIDELASKIINTLFPGVFSREKYVPLGIFTKDGKTVVVAQKNHALFYLREEENGFRVDKKELTCVNARGALENMSLCTNFSIFDIDNVPHMSYTCRGKSGRFNRVIARQSASNEYKWDITRRALIRKSDVGNVMLFSQGGNSLYGLMYKNGREYPVYSENSGKKWKYGNSPILSPRGADPDPNRNALFFDHTNTRAMGIFNIDEGILVMYQSEGSNNMYVGAALFRVHALEWKEIWRAEMPLASHDIHETGSGNMYPLGSVMSGSFIRLFWVNVEDQLYQALVHNPFKDLTEDAQGVDFKRHPNNPLIEPRDDHDWEAVATFNPAAVLIDDVIHLFYRAVGRSGQSVFGYATSTDGLTFKRSKKPAYVSCEKVSGDMDDHIAFEDLRSPWFSVDGAEDPRATAYEDRVYIMYAAFNGWQQTRSTAVSISVNDLKKKNFNKWSKRVFLSAPPTRWGTGGKNAALMPGKSHGRYVLLHRIWPNISIDYTHAGDLSEFEDENRWLEEKDTIYVRPAYWDSGKIGVGAPPIETNDGWLLIYNGVSQQHRGGYKVGAMILDKDNPSRVIYRTSRPILSPNAWYEHNGLVPHVVYVCGAVVKGDTLFIYYGGADTSVNVATAPLDDFLNNVKSDTAPPFYIRKANIV